MSKVYSGAYGHLAFFKSWTLQIQIVIMGLVLQHTVLAGTDIIKSNLPVEQRISWNKWSPAAFEQAKNENKMILVNVGIEVCFACRLMEEFTYRDPDIARIIKKNFVAIQVDADERPDIGERYSDWAWPATIFLAPDGTQVTAISGNRRPPNFLPILNGLIEQHANGKLIVDKLSPYVAVAKSESSALTEIRDRLRQVLDSDFDDVRGGWGDELKEINGSGPMMQLFIRGQADNDRVAQGRIVQTAYAMLARIDPVWGGFFSAGEDGWESPITEKRTGAEASALEVFATAYHLTNDKRFLTAAQEVDRYMREWLMARDGTFFTSQEGEPPDLPQDMSARDYFAINSSAERKSYGVPSIDHTIYTDLNGRMISGYVQLYEATGDSKYLQIATTCANAILKSRQQKAGWLTQSVKNPLMEKDGRIHLRNDDQRIYLRTQANFGVALMGLYRVSGEMHWLETARQVANGMQTLLEDKAVGGFYATTSDDTSDIVPRRKPLEDNGTASQFSYLLGKYTKDSAYFLSADRAVHAVSLRNMVEREGRIIGELAVAVELMTSDYVEFTVVGNPNQPEAHRLFESGRDFYEPRKILHYEAPGRYPDMGRPAMFICTPNACSQPIFDSKNIGKEVQKLRNALVTS